MLPGGKPPAVGDTMRNPALAATLRRIGREGREAFYDGAVMRDIVGRLKELGGLHEEADFAAQRSEWVEPIHASYRGYEVYEVPAERPGAGGADDPATARRLCARRRQSLSEADRLHLLAEATKAAYQVRDDFIADPAQVEVDVERLPVGRLGRARAPRDPARPRAAAATRGTAAPSTRTRSISARSIATATRCSFINSLFSSFGTGIMAPESGVLLHNRGTGFRTIPGHPNAIAPRKRPFHTIIPAMLAKDGRAVMPFGVMGGQYQAVGHAHFVHRMLDRGFDPQQAAEAPRSLCLPRQAAGRAGRSPSRSSPIWRAAATRSTC